jgi:hypothetical protein
VLGSQVEVDHAAAVSLDVAEVADVLLLRVGAAVLLVEGVEVRPCNGDTACQSVEGSETVETSDVPAEVHLFGNSPIAVSEAIDHTHNNGTLTRWCCHRTGCYPGIVPLSESRAVIRP